MVSDKELMKLYVHQFTPRQREVLHHVIRGLSNKQVAQKLYISEKVVAEHLTNIYEEVYTLDGIEERPTRYTVIVLFSAFFGRYSGLDAIAPVVDNG